MSPKRTRCRCTAELKVEVALAALTERQPLAELAARHQLAAARLTRWKLQLRQQARHRYYRLALGACQQCRTHLVTLRAGFR